MKEKLIFIIIVLSAFTLPKINACHSEDDEYPSDEWLIQNAITELKILYPKHKNTDFAGSIETGWHIHPHLGAPLHRHVTLTASFGYKNTGNVRWEGRSYADGGIFTFYYDNHNPDSPGLQTKIAYLGPLQYWDGTSWVSNHPEFIRNTGDSKCDVQVMGSNGLSRTIVLAKNYCLIVYPPIGVKITLSIIP